MAKAKTKSGAKKAKPVKKSPVKKSPAKKTAAVKTAKKTNSKSKGTPVKKTKPVAKAVSKSAPAKKSKPVAQAKTKAAPVKKVAKDSGSSAGKKLVTKPGKPTPVIPTKVEKPIAAKPAGKSGGGKVAPIAPKVAPLSISVKPAASSLVKSARLDDADDAPAAPVPMGTSADIFTPDELTTFRNMLNEEKRKILAKAKSATASGNIALEKDEMYDEVDLASATVEQNLTLRLLDRDRKLLAEIDHAIDKIDTGDYGFCEGTGEVIPKRRLELRPWTRHSVKYKEQLERMKKSGRGVADEDEAF